MLNHEIENRIYMLQQSHLPKDLVMKIIEADLEYLTDNTSKSEELILFVEEELKKRGLPFFGLNSRM